MFLHRIIDHLSHCLDDTEVRKVLIAKEKDTNEGACPGL